MLLLAVYSYLNIHYTVGDKLFDSPVPAIQLFGILTFVVFGIWELNRFAEMIALKRPGQFQKINPLIIVFVLSLVNVLLVSSIALVILDFFPGMNVRFNMDYILLLSAFGFRINLFLNCINAIVFYMNRYNQSQVEAEQLKKVSVEAQFEALRNQINPHFLFNCFNALSSLVYKDADTSAKFISQLASVYRYLLYNQEKKVVPLAEELAFMESYFYLLIIRFGENIVIQNRISEDIHNRYVPPAVLQMLVENAIKHNVVSKKHPLLIELFQEKDYIVISNNLQEKGVKEDSTKVGIRNIIQRYRLLSDRPVEVIRADKSFVVKIPLLLVELS